MVRSGPKESWWETAARRLEEVVASGCTSDKLAPSRGRRPHGLAGVRKSILFGSHQIHVALRKLAALGALRF